MEDKEQTEELVAEARGSSESHSSSEMNVSI
jgi:hypothetical protein